jgi:hypothetical protein
MLTSSKLERPTIQLASSECSQADVIKDTNQYCNS